MIRAALTPAVAPSLLLTALLLCAAGFSAFAQTPEAAPAPEASVASAPAAPARGQRPAQPVLPPVSALATVPTWQALTPAQRELLAPLEHDWDKLGLGQRSKWLNATPRLARLSPEELRRLHERMRDWAYLKPSERLDARVGFQVAKQVDAEQRQAKWEAYQALPPERRQELAEKAAARRRAQTQAKAGGHAAKPLAVQSKSNIVPASPKLVTPVPVTGSLLQAKPGATTVLMTRRATPPLHQAAGQPKVVADPTLVDPKTLLPKSLKAPSAASTPRP
ncbi:DUF3106 domain-containing protein [Roseateles sp.]|uniref:DUF3106 domain-containing protein n=1 Tax=Roseateles sp. TaxID=1971397 RepID=UPI0025EB3242|nr:DUF3106 domain-containing protein [Roseateles sp.]